MPNNASRDFLVGWNLHGLHALPAVVLLDGDRDSLQLPCGHSIRRVQALKDLPRGSPITSISLPAH